MIRKADLVDVVERRSMPVETFEFRSVGSNTVRMEGYASIFDKGYDIYGGPDAGGFTEYVTRSAFKKTLAAKPDVVLLLNHEGAPMARTKSGTMHLGTDSTGLTVQTELDTRDPEVQSIAVKMERGDLDEMSFAFRVLGQSWNSNETERSLEEVSLHKGDVSIVNFGANPYTSVALRNAVRLLADSDLQEGQFAELREMSAQVDRALAALQIARDDKPYGDVAYADPKNGKYPIDTKEHVKAAWSYINMPKNQKDYSPAELASIKDKIKAAAKKFGIEISDEANAQSLIDMITGLMNRSLAPNIIVDSMGSSFVQQVHDMCLNAGANCDPTDVDFPIDGGDLAPLRSISPLEDQSDDLEDGDVFEEGEPRDSTLAQAIHDMCAESGADCASVTQSSDEPEFETPVSENNSLKLGDAQLECVTAGNLSVGGAERLLRPEDAPEPLTIGAAALAIAS